MTLIKRKKIIKNTRICNFCKIEKDISNFRIDRKKSYCKKCNICDLNDHQKKVISRRKENSTLGTENIINKILELYNKNFNELEIAKQLNVNYNQIYTFCRELNLSIRIFEPTEEEILEKIKTLFYDGYGRRYITKELCISHPFVKLAYEKLKLPTKNNRPLKKIPDEKVCTICNILKPILDFRQMINNKDIGRDFYHMSYCNRCDKNSRREFKPINFNKFKDDVRKVIHDILINRRNISEDNIIFKNLQYSKEDLRTHVESLFSHSDNLDKNGNIWMSWANHGVYRKDTWKDDDSLTWTWHLDHKTPHSEFDYNFAEDQAFKNCWALSNLRPYSAKQNVLDGVRRTRHKQLTNENS